ncbi:MAG: tetratricopeptide repeat protein, partial [Acidobacteria bacterium]|nr:tetratricopeptide repeat protein [Acidobacteriota bacterium]
MKHGVFLTAVLILFPSLHPFAAAAQQRPNVAAMAPVPPGTVIVRVRTVTGAPLSAFAMVYLISTSGASADVRQPTGEGGEAVLRAIPMGSYNIEVTAPGYETHREAIDVYDGNTSYVHVNLKNEGASSSNPPTGDVLVLTPKARKELDKAREALDRGDLKKAQEQLNKAHKAAASYPEVLYLMGVLAMRRGELDAASEALKKAVRLDPNHYGANAALGRVLYELKDLPGAIQAIEKALAINGSDWSNHATIAAAYFNEKQFDKARYHAERAVAATEGKRPHLRLILAHALNATGDYKTALQELQTIIGMNASADVVASARSLEESIRGRRQEMDSPTVSAKAMVSETVSDIPLAVADWAPPNVDGMKPAVDPGVACSLADVLRNAGKRVLNLAENMQSITANELIEHADISAQGSIGMTVSGKFTYMVAIRKVRPKVWLVDETRNGQNGDSFPSRFVSTGLAALAMIFHPDYVDRFEVRCEGLETWRGQPAWHVYFRQKSEQNGVRSYYMRDKGSQDRFPIPLKGRAWIAANSFQILRLETDLVRP